MIRVTPVCQFAVLLLTSAFASPPAKVTVAWDAPGKPISPDLFDILFEDLS